MTGATKPPFRVVHPDAQAPEHTSLVRDIERSMMDGELRHSSVAHTVLAVLREEPRLELAPDCDPIWLTRGILASDEYFVPVSGSAGHRDWQKDFAQTVTPTLVGVSRSLVRSADAQAVVLRLCEAITARLRLILVWPEDPDESNDLRNAIYRTCLGATELESDEVMLQLRRLTVLGPR